MKLSRAERQFGNLVVAIVFLVHGVDLSFFNTLPFSKDDLVFHEGQLIEAGRTNSYKAMNNNDYAKILSEGELVGFQVFIEPHQLQEGAHMEAFVYSDWREGRSALELKANGVVLYSFSDMREELQGYRDSSRKYGWPMIFAGLFFAFRAVKG